MVHRARRPGRGRLRRGARGTAHALCADGFGGDPADDAVTLTAVRHQYPLVSLGDRGARLEIGDVYAREPKSVLAEFFVPALLDASGSGRDAGEVRVAELVVVAHVLTEHGGVERQEITFPIVSRLTAAGHAEPEVRREMLLLDAARAREDALRMRDEGDLGGAAGVLRSVSRMMAASPAAYGVALDDALAEQVSDLAELADRFVAEGVSEQDAKYMAQRAYNAHRGKRLYEAKLSRAASRRPPGAA